MVELFLDVASVFFFYQSFATSPTRRQYSLYAPLWEGKSPECSAFISCLSSEITFNERCSLYSYNRHACLQRAWDLHVDVRRHSNVAGSINILKPTGCVHQQVCHWRIDIPPTLYLFVLYLSLNKQRLLPRITYNDWFL